MGLLDSFNDPSTQGLLGAAAKMLEASGPSRMPIGFGQILGTGYLGGMQAYQGAQLAQQDAETQRAKLQMLKLQEQRAQQQFDLQRDAYNRIGAPASSMGGLASALPPAAGASMPGGGSAQPGAEGMSLDDLRRAAIAGLPGAKELFEIHKYQNEPQKLEAGSTYRDRTTGQERYMPKLDNGFTLGADGRASVLPGYAEGSASIKGAEAGAQEEAKARFDIVNPTSYPSINGVPVNGSISRLNLVNQLSGGQVPPGGAPTAAPAFQPDQSAAPWDRIVAPGERDQVRSRTFEQANKSLDDLRAQVTKGRDVMRDLGRFGVLNQQSGTGGLADRVGFLPTLDSGKREMESITARLAPSVRPAGSGSSSDRDMALYLSALPGVEKTGNVNKNIRLQYEKSLDEAQARLKFSERFLTTNGHLQGADQAYDSYRQTAGFDPAKLSPDQRAYMQQNYPQEYEDGVKAFNLRPSTQAQAAQAAPAAPAAKKVATLADIVATAKRSGKSTKQVTADLRAAGYSIGGQ